jgi:hypothetical protein
MSWDKNYWSPGKLKIMPDWSGRQGKIKLFGSYLYIIKKS